MWARWVGVGSEIGSDWMDSVRYSWWKEGGGVGVRGGGRGEGKEGRKERKRGRVGAWMLGEWI